jgi:hypothetical protein
LFNLNAAGAADTWSSFQWSFLNASSVVARQYAERDGPRTVKTRVRFLGKLIPV